MDLQSLLKKTEAKSEKIRTTRTVPSVATEDRPYTNDLSAVEPVMAPIPPSKRVTNGVQTEYKQVTQQSTERAQTEHKQVTRSALANTKRSTEQSTERAQTEHKQVTQQSTNFRLEYLRGHEAKLLQFIFQECLNTGDLLTPPITPDRIAALLGVKKSTVKTIVYRLTHKNFVSREGSAAGRGGFTRFRIERMTYQTLLLRANGSKQSTERAQTGNTTEYRTEHKLP